MPIQREGKFWVTRDLGIVPSIGIESSKLRACLAEAKSFEGVFGAPFFGFRGDDLDFLSKLPHLRQIWFFECSFESVDGLYAVPSLEHCGVMQKRPGIDFSKFRHLDTLVAHWNAKDSGFERSTVRKFFLWHYKPRSNSFEGLVLPPRASCLELNWVNPASLQGLEPLNELQELGIHRSRNIEDLSLLPLFAPNLRKLIVTTCGRLTKFAGIEDHPALELAIVDGRRVKDTARTAANLSG